jgi:predicted ribosomally synthesized peptide with nif11-like leader
MSKETAKKLIAELRTNDELNAKIRGITDPSQLVQIAAAEGYDVTVEEMSEAEKEFRSEKTKKTKLSVEELDSVAGGEVWEGDDAPDNHEMGCTLSYYGYYYQKTTNTWCHDLFYCEKNNYPAPEGWGYDKL